MRSLSGLAAIVVGIRASRPINEALLNEEILSTYIIFACSFDPEGIPNTIPKSVGGQNLAKFFCEWARLSEEDFFRSASTVVQETHDFVMGESDMREGLQDNIDSARRAGAESDAEVLAVLTERYRQMLRSLKECNSAM